MQVLTDELWRRITDHIVSIPDNPRARLAVATIISAMNDPQMDVGERPERTGPYPSQSAQGIVRRWYHQGTLRSLMAFIEKEGVTNGWPSFDDHPSVPVTLRDMIRKELAVVRDISSFKVPNGDAHLLDDAHGGGRPDTHRASPISKPDRTKSARWDSLFEAIPELSTSEGSRMALNDLDVFMRRRGATWRKLGLASHMMVRRWREGGLLARIIEVMTELDLTDEWLIDRKTRKHPVHRSMTSDIIDMVLSARRGNGKPDC
jgi:hypothetical protein